MFEDFGAIRGVEMLKEPLVTDIGDRVLTSQLYASMFDLTR